MQEFQPREGQEYAHTGNHSIDSKKTQIEKKKWNMKASALIITWVAYKKNVYYIVKCFCEFMADIYPALQKIQVFHGFLQ